MDVTNYRIRSDKPVSARISVASDIHGCETDEILKKLAESKPDMIAVPGDLAGGNDVPDRSAEFLREAAKIAPVFFSIGNHERKRCFDCGKAAASGAVVLDDAYTVSGDFAVGGLSSGFGRTGQSNFKETPPPDVSWLDDFCALGSYKILLSHHPEYYERYLKNRLIDLILSGHAHGGQWRFFGIGVFAPGQGLFPKYTSGIYDGRLIVSRGLCNHSFVPRLFNHTELINVDINK